MHVFRPGQANPWFELQRRPPRLDLESFKVLRRSIEPSAGYLRILIPTGDANYRFCRTTLSAAILGYPTPSAIDWGGESNDDKFGDLSWEWGKTHGTLQYLQNIEESRRDDLVLIVDNEDSWFQLKPEVLIHRYRDIIKQADKRLRNSLDGDQEGVKRPEIVFAARKKCYAHKKDHIGCYAAPEPPKYVYLPTGEKVERFVSEDRPRFLSSILMMGTVKSLLDLHQLAWERWNNNPTLYSSRDDLFASLFGEQEYQREQLRKSSLSLFQRIFRPANKESFLDHAPPLHLMFAQNLTTADYGITLDYTSLLGHIPSKTGDWVRFAEPQSIYSAAASLNLPSAGPPSVEIARDIHISRPPLWSLAPYSSAYPFEYEDLPRDMPWRNMPLYTNLATSVTPALILNRNEMEEDQLQQQWKKMWFTPYMRKKMQNLAYEPQLPIATTTNPNLPQRLREMTRQWRHKGRGRPLGEKQWWSSVWVSPVDKARRGLGWLVQDNKWKTWAEECPEDAQVGIIGDDKGKWEDLRVYPPFPDLDKTWW